MNLCRLFSFYTTWSLIMHMMYYLGWIKSTYLIFLYVTYVGDFILLSYSQNTPIMFLLLGIIIHKLPIIFLNFEKEYNWDLLCFSLLMYVIILGPAKIDRIYSSPYHYIINYT